MPVGTGVCPACLKENTLVIKRGTLATSICVLCGWTDGKPKGKPAKAPKGRRNSRP